MPCLRNRAPRGLQVAASWWPGRVVATRAFRLPPAENTSHFRRTSCGEHHATAVTTAGHRPRSGYMTIPRDLACSLPVCDTFTSADLSTPRGALHKRASRQPELTALAIVDSGIAENTGPDEELLRAELTEVYAQPNHPTRNIHGYAQDCPPFLLKVASA